MKIRRGRFALPGEVCCAHQYCGRNDVRGSVPAPPLFIIYWFGHQTLKLLSSLMVQLCEQAKGCYGTSGCERIAGRSAQRVAPTGGEAAMPRHEVGGRGGISRTAQGHDHSSMRPRHAARTRYAGDGRAGGFAGTGDPARHVIGGPTGAAHSRPGLVQPWPNRSCASRMA